MNRLDKIKAKFLLWYNTHPNDSFFWYWLGMILFSIILIIVFSGIGLIG